MLEPRGFRLLFRRRPLQALLYTFSTPVVLNYSLWSFASSSIMTLTNLDIDSRIPSCAQDLIASSGDRHTFFSLPVEVLSSILSYLDIPELHAVAQTCRCLRVLSCDPLLHLRRLRDVPGILELCLPLRPPLSSIAPPQGTIWLNRTHILARRVSRSLIAIRLNHNLSPRTRPSATDLVARAILPSECLKNHSCSTTIPSPAYLQSRHDLSKARLRTSLKHKLSDRPSLDLLIQQNIIPAEARLLSPGILAKRRKIIRELLKDGLRAWVESRGITAQKRKSEEQDLLERKTVKGLVRNISRRYSNEQSVGGSAHEKKLARQKWGREAEIKKRLEVRQPTRAHVLSLRRFWEGATKAAS